jgi:hypothetical protein
MMEIQEFKRGIKPLEQYFDHPLSEPQIEIWKEVFNDYTLAELREAIMKYFKYSEQVEFPSPGRLRKYGPNKDFV